MPKTSHNRFSFDEHFSDIVLSMMGNNSLFLLIFDFLWCWTFRGRGAHTRLHDNNIIRKIYQHKEENDIIRAMCLYVNKCALYVY